MNSFPCAVCDHKSYRTFFEQFRIEDQAIHRHSDANPSSSVYGHIGHSQQRLEECRSVTVLKRTDRTSGFVKQNCWYALQLSEPLRPAVCTLQNCTGIWPLAVDVSAQSANGIRIFQENLTSNPPLRATSAYMSNAHISSCRSRFRQIRFLCDASPNHQAAVIRTQNTWLPPSRRPPFSRTGCPA